jgi:hypothetical protein
MAHVGVGRSARRRSFHGMPKKAPRPRSREYWDLECPCCASGLPHALHPAQFDPSPVEGDLPLIDGVSDHVARHVGPIAHVLHEVGSRGVHVDVHIVRPTDDRPHYTLVTSGMSQLPMTTPPGLEAYAYGELVMKLPRTWRMSLRSWRDEKHFWPIRWLKNLARHPHEVGTWLGRGHTIPNGVDAASFAANTQMCCIILDVVRDPPGLAELELPDGRRITFYTLVPILFDEMQYKLLHGASALRSALQRSHVGEVIAPRRASAIGLMERRMMHLRLSLADFSDSTQH